MSSRLQNKLHHFEATPPTGVWEKIEDNLNDTQEYATRLYNFEEQPPVNVWQKIETSLEEAPAKIVPFRTRFKRPIRYASVAAMITVVLVTATLLRKKTEAGALSTQTAAINPAVPKETQQSTIASLPKNEVSTVPSNSAVKESNTQSSSKKQTATVNIQENDRRTSDFLATKIKTKELNAFSWAEGSTVYVDGEKNTMRVPNKLFRLLNCRPQDAGCKQRIIELHQKLMANKAAGFAGMLDMLYQLQ